MESSPLSRHLSSAPFDPSLLSTCYSAVCDGKVKSNCSLWRLVGESDGTDVSQLEHVVDLDLQENNVRWCVLDYLQDHTFIM